MYSSVGRSVGRSVRRSLGPLVCLLHMNKLLKLQADARDFGHNQHIMYNSNEEDVFEIAKASIDNDYEGLVHYSPLFVIRTLAGPSISGLNTEAQPH